MENENQKQPKNMFAPICITQLVCVSVLIIVVLIIKFFSKNTFEKIEEWHNKNFLEETIITAVFEEE